MKRFAVVLVLIFSLCVICSCLTAKKPIELAEPIKLQCKFTDGEFFDTYEFIKIRTIMPDGSIEDIRTSFEKKYEVLRSDPTKGAFLKSGMRKIIVVKYQGTEIVGNAILNPMGEFEKHEGDPGISKAQMKQMQKFRYLRVDQYGRLLAYGDNLPETVTLDTDFSGVKGFAQPLLGQPFISDSPFGWIIPNIAIDQDSFWDHMSYAPLKHANAAAQFKVRMKTKAFTETTFQVVGYGDFSGKTIGGSPEVKAASYFSQTFFSIPNGFVRSHKSESEMTYVSEDGKRYRQTWNYTMNNSKVKRDVGAGSY